MPTYSPQSPDLRRGHDVLLRAYDSFGKLTAAISDSGNAFLPQVVRAPLVSESIVFVRRDGPPPVIGSQSIAIVDSDALVFLIPPGGCIAIGEFTASERADIDDRIREVNRPVAALCCPGCVGQISKGTNDKGDEGDADVENTAGAASGAPGVDVRTPAGADKPAQTAPVPVQPPVQSKATRSGKVVSTPAVPTGSTEGTGA